MAKELKPIECSAQPLSISFHPTRDLVAAGLVDGTLEVHDLFAKQHGGDDDEADTILSSIYVAKGGSPSSSSSPSLLGAVSGDDNRESGGGSGQKPHSSSSLPALTVVPGRARQDPSCRAVLFSRSSNDDDGAETSGGGGGEHLFSACNGGSLRCLDSERACSLPSFSNGDGAPPDPSSHPAVLWSVESAHSAGIRELYQLPHRSPAGPLLCSGDDAGVIRLWDARICGGGGTGVANAGRKNPNKTAFDDLMKLPRGCVAHWKVHSDYVSGFDCSPPDGDALLACSADGRLSVFDLRFLATARRRREDGTAGWAGYDTGGAAVHVVAVDGDDDDPADLERRKKTWETGGYRRSDPQGDELLSVRILKRRRKVVCGTQEGPLHVWSYGTWGDASDRFPGHPGSVDALLRVDEDTLLTGSSDGLVRAVQLQPNKFLGVLGGHDGFPVEALEFGAGRKVVGSVSHDEYVRLWDASVLNGDDDDDGDDDEMAEENGRTVAAAIAVSAVAAVANSGGGSDDEWDDMDEEEDEDMKDDDDIDSDDSASDDGGGKGDKNKRSNIFKTDNETFFEDL